jgi:hypothetical protein
MIAEWDEFLPEDPLKKLAGKSPLNRLFAGKTIPMDGRG